MSSGNSAPPERVAEMFDRISGVYDGMNLAISGFQEPRWRRRAIREARLRPGGPGAGRGLRHRQGHA